MKYNYLESMKEAIKNYIEENKENESYNWNDLEEAKELLYDDLWIDDSVTGNGSGSYYCNSYKARESLQGNEDLLIEALEEFGNDSESYKRALTDPEFGDVSIRCYLLNQAIDEVIEEMTTEESKTRIKIIKSMEIIQDGETTKKELYHEFTNNLNDAIKKLNDEELKKYNNKFVTITETIEAIYKTDTGYKKIYKTIKTDGSIEKKY